MPNSTVQGFLFLLYLNFHFSTPNDNANWFKAPFRLFLYILGIPTTREGYGILAGLATIAFDHFFVFYVMSFSQMIDLCDAA